MNPQIFAWDRSYSSLRTKTPWIEYFCLLGLLLAAILLFRFHLGSLPLTPEEKLLADKALQISEKATAFPLVPRLIAFSYSIYGHTIANYWTTRLPGAFLTALSVPLLYSLTGELYVTRWPRIFAALMYLMCLPVVCSGRLANSTGASLFLMIWTMYCVLVSRRNLRWGLGVGIGLSLMSLTDGVSFLALTTVIVIFLYWDTPRLLTSKYFGIGVLLGLFPTLLWHWLLWPKNLHTILTFIWPLGLSWYKILDFLVHSVPWFIFWASGVKFALQSRPWSWAKLVLTWLGVVGFSVLFFSLKVPELILLSTPAFSLAGGTILAEIKTWPVAKPYPYFWNSIFLSLSALASSFCLLLFCQIVFNHSTRQPIYFLIFLALTITLVLTTLLISKRDQQFIATLFWGMYLVLLLLLSSGHWTKLG